MTCTTCGRNPEKVNDDWHECSHADCPHRRHAWSERPSPRLNAPCPKNVEVDADPTPLDKFYRQRGYSALWWLVITAISSLGAVVIVATRNSPV